jgi:nucleoid-associated protein YgaU
MPKDARLGLVVGVALVIAVAVVFFRKDGAGGLTVFAEPGLSKPADATPNPAAHHDAGHAAPVNQVSMPKGSPPDRNDRHVIRPGDTLFSIAQQRYGDGEQFYAIYQANRDVLKSPDNLPSGVTLRLPPR